MIVSTFVYDNRGNLMSVDTTYDYGSDGTVEETDHEAFTRDQKGRELTIHLDRHQPDRGRDVHLRQARQPDLGRGRLRLPRRPWVPDEKSVGTSEYDAHGNFRPGSTSATPTTTRARPRCSA